MNKTSFLGISLCLFNLCVLSGCGSPENIAPASGVVTLDGKPVSDGRVMFHPVDGSRSSHATTNEKGEFKVSTFGVHDGGLVGRHLVTVTKIDTSSQIKIDPKEGYMGASYEKMMSPEALKQNIKPKQTLPIKYATKETSGIELEIIKGQANNFPLNLESGN